ncbi:hypothetical protein [Rathayibacter toxicus]|uniref:4-hydroxybenzoate polyprenyltransferase n=1 Tax=Rathayibacter toxicus TaxID=145458 RepID=A0A0C5B9V6_9MICO|nr:hypothetical protein [Rathayibacter toxicus]AJM77628.1 hypothetical protein TI83_06130 [Rathayibacter toxicus]ALS56435.1 hypothetical protein APU90_00350 [Rathayibacter toxicus]KKM44543.1 hypothetical protein VT73_08310 [Rathayibacter toxicus]PPG21746.1 hypothetical protein C5D15_05935 [Rathayibacter toxicus]PPG46708.1 hypothetical protein C5D16_05910 [Rathayibacter toxicus]
MSLATTVIAEASTHAQLPFPAIVFPLIAVAAFTALAIVTWSYRDVANRHAHKTAVGSHDQHGHGH